eukprot:gene8584-6024_t
MSEHISFYCPPLPFFLTFYYSLTKRNDSRLLPSSRFNLKQIAIGLSISHLLAISPTSAPQLRHRFTDDLLRLPPRYFSLFNPPHLVTTSQSRSAGEQHFYKLNPLTSHASTSDIPAPLRNNFVSPDTTMEERAPFQYDPYDKDAPAQDDSHVVVNEETQQLIAERMVQSLLQSNVPIHITINPAEGQMQQAAPNGGHALNSKHAGIVGLMAFGMTTVLLNLVNLGVYDLGSVLPSMAIPFGGAAQLICGVLEYFNNNNFGFIAFMAYGSFWLTLTCVWMLPTSASAQVAPGPSSGGLTATYLLLWGIFTSVMFYCTLYKNVALAVVFGTLILLFLLLAIGDYSKNEKVTKAAGGIGLVCGASAMYTSLAELLVNQFGHEIFPLIQLPLKKRHND